jgi:hypothetical protein
MRLEILVIKGAIWYHLKQIHPRKQIFRSILFIANKIIFWSIRLGSGVLKGVIVINFAAFLLSAIFNY